MKAGTHRSVPHLLPWHCVECRQTNHSVTVFPKTLRSFRSPPSPLLLVLLFPQQSVRPTLHPAETHFRHIQQTNGSRVSLGGSALWRPPVKQANKSKRSIHPAAISALCLHTATAVDMPIFCRSFLSESNDRQDVCKTSAGQG